MFIVPGEGELRPCSVTGGGGGTLKSFAFNLFINIKTFSNISISVHMHKRKFPQKFRDRMPGK